jgi:hypothetical protein
MEEITNRWESLEIRVSLGEPGKVRKTIHYDPEYLYEMRLLVYSLSNRVSPHDDAGRRYVIMAEAGIQRQVMIIDVPDNEPHWIDSPLKKVACFRRDDGSYDIYDPKEGLNS